MPFSFSSLVEGAPNIFLACTDGSVERSSKIISLTLKLMRPKDRVILLHISGEDDYLMGEKATSVVVKKELTPILKAAMVDFGFVCVPKDTTKAVARQILAEANARGAHFLMLASKYQEHGRLGSVTDAVIKNARCTCVACKV
jgi:hypothetical protein